MTSHKKVYAVKKGWKPGLYDQWYGQDGAEKQVSGFNGAKHRKFYDIETAMKWMGDVNIDELEAPANFNPSGFAITLMLVPCGKSEEWAEYVAADIIDAETVDKAENNMLEMYWSDKHQARGKPLFSTIDMKEEKTGAFNKCDNMSDSSPSPF